MNKAEKEFCERCPSHKDCGWVLRNMESDCTELDLFSAGYGKAVEKTVDWLYKQLNEGSMECGNMEKFVEDFKKAMEE